MKNKRTEAQRWVSILFLYKRKRSTSKGTCSHTVVAGEVKFAKCDTW
jgi:hypothetical protein